MKIDLPVASLLLQVLMFVSAVCGGYGAFVRLQAGQAHNRELAEAGMKQFHDLMERELKAIREKIDDHVHSDREDFAELRLVMKADQAAAANIHDVQVEIRSELRSLSEWRREVTRRNGPQGPSVGA